MKPKRIKKTAISPMEAGCAQVILMGKNFKRCNGFRILVNPYDDTVSVMTWGLSGVEIPRQTFNKLIRWYQTEQKFVRK